MRIVGINGRPTVLWSLTRPALSRHKSISKPRIEIWMSSTGVAITQALFSTSVRDLSPRNYHWPAYVGRCMEASRAHGCEGNSGVAVVDSGPGGPNCDSGRSMARPR